MLRSAVSKVMWVGRASRAPLYALGVVAAVVVALLLGALTARSAHAETLEVDRTDDSAGVPVSEPCTNAPSDCSLRWAIEGRSTTNGQTDTITFASNVRGTITLTAGQLLIVNDSPARDLIISGPGAGGLAVSGNNVSRVFEIASGAGATINGLTIRNGKVTSTHDGGGINNLGTLTVNNTTVSANTSESSAGGGINNEGTLTLNNSTVSSNKASSFQGGGIMNMGGVLNLNNTIVSGNDANGGGGIQNRSSITTPTTPGRATLTNSTVSNNTTGNDGGGIESSDGTLTLTNSTVSGNTSSDDSGGIEFTGTAANTLTLTNSTVTNNTTDDKGGGIGNGGTLRITNSTVTNNTTGEDGSAFSSGGGIYNYSGGTATLSNTIVARNSAPVTDDVGEASPNSFTSQGNNLIGNTSGSSGWGTSDLKNANPLLGPLQNNGGPTDTHALLPGSPAVDAGRNTTCPFTDQRGVTRRDGDKNGSVICDIGAFERNDLTAPRVTTTSPTDGKTGVRRSANLSATFSEKMDRTTLTTSTFKLFKVNRDGTLTQVTNVKVGSTTDGLKVILNPFGTSTTVLAANTRYRAVVTTAAKDVAGNRLDQNSTATGSQPMVWTFTTGSS